MTTYNTVTYGSIDVSYLDELDGGGARFGQDYLSFIPGHVGKVGRAMEWCSGPGFIGFSMLAAGLCEELTLVDINPVAIAACQQTVRSNGLAGRVRVCHSDCMDALQPGDRYDLVVANPPHHPGVAASPGGHAQLLYNDLEWRIHRKFYREIPDHLSDAGRVILQEDAYLSNVDDFREMIEDAGLELVGAFPGVWARDYYYVESRLAAVPAATSTSTGQNC